MFSSRQSQRQAPIRGARCAPLFLAALALTALSACESPTDPEAVDSAVEPAAAAATVAPTLVPVPSGLTGCQAPVEYETGDPDHPTAFYQICWPAAWNGSFIVYAHGYTFAGLDLSIPEEAATLAPFVMQQGFGFASTSYRVNGLAIKEGVGDMVILADKVRYEARAPVPVLIAGASEGGAVTTLAAERYPGVFQGALSTCGPTGNFQKQLDYFGDFNVVFNYFFPRVFAGKVTPEGVDESVMLGWEDVYMPAARDAVLGNPVSARKLVKVAGVAVASDDPADLWNAIERILWYNVFATNDAIDKLGGQPFDNTRRWYSGSGQDFRLNWRVQRISADPGARAAVAADYQTSGDLAMPYVSLHTTGDEVVQFVQQPWYRLKALLSGASAEHSALPIFRYGHCNFQEGDMAVGLALLMLKVGAASSPSLATAMPTPTARATFQDLAKEMQPRR
ncbi:MAG: hypothetical protein PVJ02_16130 [Gemmatimonadota bacterium]|jgi:pimeloyl-ACP methyl ester carboxylesterase